MIGPKLNNFIPGCKTASCHENKRDYFLPISLFANWPVGQLANTSGLPFLLTPAIVLNKVLLAYFCFDKVRSRGCQEGMDTKWENNKMKLEPITVTTSCLYLGSICVLSNRILYLRVIYIYIYISKRWRS